MQFTLGVFTQGKSYNQLINNKLHTTRYNPTSGTFQRPKADSALQSARRFCGGALPRGEGLGGGNVSRIRPAGRDSPPGTCLGQRPHGRGLGGYAPQSIEDYGLQVVRDNGRKSIKKESVSPAIGTNRPSLRQNWLYRATCSLQDRRS